MARQGARETERKSPEAFRGGDMELLLAKEYWITPKSLGCTERAFGGHPFVGTRRRGTLLVFHVCKFV